jgi:DNA mismatch repair protein MutL
MIAVLAPHVIDQIAAGEVIERPASVVKELVENALDAGATTITIEVAAGGRSLVRVSDDGCGMGAEAAVLALERHATSKLREVDDLWGIASMGFRGEALPSIASVSRMALTTRRSGDDAATRIAIDAGRLISVSDVGAPVGTTVEVTDLLYNTPARLKFLKGEATEASHVTELVAKIAMAYPRIHVRLKHNGRTSLDVPPDRDGFSRAQALLGPRVAARLIPVIGEESGVRVTAYLGAPELAQATARGVQLFVGRRPVRDRGLLHALAMGYGELVPRGRYPIAVVLVDVPAGAVDVNVHPQKLEVRFSDAAVVAAAVRHIVQAGVSSARWRDEAGGAGPVQMIASVAPPVLPFDGQAATQLAERHVAQMRSRQVPLGFAAPLEPTAATSSSSRAGRAGAAGTAGTAGTARDWARTLRDQTRAARAGESRSAPPTCDGDPTPAPILADRRSPGQQAAGPVRSDRFDSAPDSPPDLGNVASRSWSASDSPPGEPAVGAKPKPYPSIPSLLEQIDPPGRTTATPAPAASFLATRAPATTSSPTPWRADVRASATHGYFSHLRYLGQLDLTYLACEGDGELVLIDQHAAHERVELDRLRERHTHGAGDARVAVQNMLFPVTLDATQPQLELVARVGDLLSQVGFEVEPFGKATLAVKAVPAGIRHGDPAQLLRSLLQEWAEAGAPSEAERLDALLGEIACHSVVRAGDRLTGSEAETLLRSLDGVDLSLPAPHGRAVLLRLPLSEIGRRFGR